MISRVDMLLIVIVIGFCFAVIEQNAVVTVEARARQNDLFGALRSELFNNALDELLVVFLAVGSACQVACLCDVGKHDVSLCAELSHLLGEILVKGGVELAVVSHSWVDDNEVALGLEVVDQLDDLCDLLSGSEVSRVERVKGDALVFPVLGYR